MKKSKIYKPKGLLIRMCTMRGGSYNEPATACTDTIEELCCLGFPDYGFRVYMVPKDAPKIE